MKPKNPILAAILNVIIPGLGCAYAGSWFYAIIFFVWVPLAYIASLVISGFVSTLVAGTVEALFQGIDAKNFLFFTIEILLCARILYEQTTMPYQMAKDWNQKIETCK